MSRAILGADDIYVQQFADALGEWDAAHEHAQIAVRRVNSACVHIRIIDPDFLGTRRRDRHDQVWSILEKLPDDTIQELSMLLLLTPDEAKKSYASMEFDEPVDVNA